MKNLPTPTSKKLPVGLEVIRLLRPPAEMFPPRVKGDPEEGFMMILVIGPSSGS